MFGAGRVMRGVRRLEDPVSSSLCTLRNTLILACLLVSCSQQGRVSTYKTDLEMVTHFNSHRTDFDKLLAMFEADTGLQYFSRGQTRPKDVSTSGVSPQRLEEYQEIFSKLGLDGIGDLSGSNKNEIWFSP